MNREQAMGRLLAGAGHELLDRFLEPLGVFRRVDVRGGDRVEAVRQEGPGELARGPAMAADQGAEVELEARAGANRCPRALDRLEFPRTLGVRDQQTHAVDLESKEDLP